MTGARRALLGRVVLVVGADDAVGRAVALHLAALGASLAVAGPRTSEVVVTAGLVASARGTARVVEEPAPPLLGGPLVRRATVLLAVPTDAVVAAGAFASPAAAEAAARDLAAALPPGALVLVAKAAPRGGATAGAAEVVRRLREAGARPVGPGDAAT